MNTKKISVILCSVKIYYERTYLGYVERIEKFGAIVTSFVNDIITPLILNPALKAAGVEKIAELTWNGVAYGSFLSAVINILVIGTVLFFVVKAAEKAQNLGKKEEAVEEEAAAPTQEELLAEIRDLLANK